MEIGGWCRGEGKIMGEDFKKISGQGGGVVIYGGNEITKNNGRSNIGVWYTGPEAKSSKEWVRVTQVCQH